ncbi:MAG: hypothetical protein ABIC40_01045 [bacterium]
MIDSIKNTTGVILAVDPGRDKCGLAVLDSDGNIIFKSVCARNSIITQVESMVENFKPEFIALGDGTGSKEIKNEIGVKEDIEILSIPEKNTTLEARELAWNNKAPCGIWCLIPKLFWPSPPDCDAWAAVVIGKKALAIIDSKEKMVK